MPEILEVEYYRALAEGALERTIAQVVVPDPHCLGAPNTPEMVAGALVGTKFVAARRRGKLLLLETPGPSVGVRFGMTGGLVLDNKVAIERLLYAPDTLSERWVRFRLVFADGGALELHDPRRFGRVSLDPDEDALGPDAWSVTVGQLGRALAARSGGTGPPLKTRLQDQTRLAGIGNLLADEILWRAGLSPLRPSGSLTGPELRRLQRHLVGTLNQLWARGGSHLGDLMTERRRDGHCPRDGAELTRATVGGRTTWWCPKHQR